MSLRSSDEPGLCQYNAHFCKHTDPMTLPILQTGEPVLRKAARLLRPNEIRSREIHDLIEEMKQAMYAAPGVGLAAPQIGRGIQLAVIEDREQYMKDWTAEQLAERERKPVPFHVIINPRLTWMDDQRVEFFEGCLSVQGMIALAPRSRRVRVECLDETAKPKIIEATGWYARILQHEIDHLLGTLYLDHMVSRTLMTVENYKKFWLGKNLDDLKTELGADSQRRI